MKRLEGNLKLYRGEENCPECFEGTQKGLIWLYEKVWNEAEKNNSKFLIDYFEDYASVGLIDFESNDNTPTSLKALLFNRCCKSSSISMAAVVPEFKKWYVSTYQKMK